MEATLTDAELLQAVLAGDEEAFTALYRRRQRAVYRFAYEMSGSAVVAEEVTQEVFLALMRDARRYDASRGTVATYLYGIARHQVLRMLEKDRKMVSIDETDQAEPAAQEDPLVELTRRERVELVRRAVLSLPANYREAVVLCDLHEMGYEEAAEALGCAVGTIRSRLHRGRALLVEKLSGLLGSPRERCTA